jgi:hypothetical protein
MNFVAIILSVAFLVILASGLDGIIKAIKGLPGWKEYKEEDRK